MHLQTTADYIATHAVTILLLVTLAMALTTAVLWHVIERLGPALLRRATQLSSALAAHPLTQRAQSVPMLGAAMNRTLSVGRYLGVHALISFIVALLTIATFVELADEIGIGESLARFDLALSRALATQLSDTVLRASSILTHLGDSPVLTAITIVIAIALVLRRERLLAIAWLVTTAGGGTLTLLLKSWFARSRPLHEHDYATVSGWSFPSGHAAGSMLVYGLLGYLVVRHTQSRWHIPVVIACLLLIVFVGSSRVLLQVHYFSDVLAGWASATAWMSMCIAGLEAVRRQSKHPVRASDGSGGE